MKVLNIKRINCIILALGALSQACTHLCEAPDEEQDCLEYASTNGTLLITDFSEGSQVCSVIEIWQNSLEMELRITCEQDRGNPYGRLSIEGNDGKHQQGWTGGGWSLPLWDCSKGLDISAYHVLKIDLRFIEGGYLHFSKFRLEDAEGQGTLELPLQVYGTHSYTWQTFSFPLVDFMKDTSLRVDLERVTRILSIAAHNGTFGHNIDGIMEFDNIRFE